MEEFDLVEADFQQYYQLDVTKLPFRKYARLFANLPVESRVIKKLAPTANWTWRDETLSRILRELEILNAAFFNANRSKGTKPEKAGEQFQPEDVKKAKEAYKLEQENKEKDEVELKRMRAFWAARNPEVKTS